MANPTLKARVTLNDSLFRSGLNKIITSAQAAGVKIKSALGNLGSMAGGAIKFTGILLFANAVASATASIVGLKNAFDVGGNLSDLSAQTAAGAGNLLVLQQAFKDTGIGAEALGGSLNKVQDKIFDASQGNKEAIKLFADLGLQWEDLAKIKPDQQFLKVGEAISKLGSQEAKVNAARSLFGKQGGKMLSLFGDSGAISAASNAIGSQAKIFEENAALFDSVSDKLGRAGLKLQGFWAGAASRLAPGLDKLLTRFEKQDWASAGIKFADSLKTGWGIIQAAFKASIPFAEAVGLYLQQGLAKAGNFFAGLITGLTKLFIDEKFMEGAIKGVFFSFVSFANQAFQDTKNSFVIVANEMAKALAVAFEAPLKEINDNFTALSEFALNPLGFRNKDKADSLDKEIALYTKLQKSQENARDKFRAEGNTEKADRFQRDAALTVANKQEAVQKRAELGAIPRTMEEIRAQDASPVGKWISEFDKTISQAKSNIGKTDPVAAEFDAKAQKAFGQTQAPIDRFIGTVTKDQFGAEKLGGQADAKLAEAGKLLATGMVQETKTQESGKPAKAVWNPSLTAGLGIGTTGGIGSVGGIGSKGNGLSVAAYGQSNVLSKKERMAFQNAAVAKGQMGADERASTPGAFGVIRRGDRARAKEVERERAREKSGVEKSNDLLSRLVNVMEPAFGPGAK